MGVQLSQRALHVWPRLGLERSNRRNVLGHQVVHEGVHPQVLVVVEQQLPHRVLERRVDERLEPAHIHNLKFQVLIVRQAVGERGIRRRLLS